MISYIRISWPAVSWIDDTTFTSDSTTYSIFDHLAHFLLYEHKISTRFTINRLYQYTVFRAISNRDRAT